MITVIAVVYLSFIGLFAYSIQPIKTQQRMLRQRKSKAIIAKYQKAK